MENKFITFQIASLSLSQGKGYFLGGKEKKEHDEIPHDRIILNSHFLFVFSCFVFFLREPSTEKYSQVLYILIPKAPNDS